jgi:hypothetical protein
MNTPFSPDPNNPRLYTLKPVEYDPKQPLTPEFCRMSDLQALFGIKRGLAYLLVNEGKIKTVSLRRLGNVKGVRLVHVASVREYLNSLLETQNNQQETVNE